MTTATCRSCGAPIVWVITEAGKRMPIDREPHPDGNVIPSVDLDGKVRARVVTAPFDGNAWRSHFVTCPNANQHRN